MGESAALRRATGYQSSGARAERRQLRTRRSHTSSKWSWITKVKVYMYVPSWTTCLRWLEVLPDKAGGRPQNGEGLKAIQSSGVWYPLVKRPGAKHHPKATQNGHTERCNPPKALPGREQAARPQAQAGRMAQEANAQSNVWDTLTWAGYQGR
jgi:hypothetical protein